jgi:hypothetical protein
MQKANILSLVRSLLTFIGSFVIGHAIFGTAITSTAWDIILGSVIALVGTVWGILDKSVTIEQGQSTLRSAVLSISGIFVAAGSQAANNISTILAATPALITVIQSVLDKQKVQAIANGTLTPSATTGKVVAKTPAIGTSNVPSSSAKSL